MMRNGNNTTTNTTTTVQVAGGVDRSGAVLVLGLLLVAANVVASGDLLPNLAPGATGLPSPGTFARIGVMLLGVGILVLVAKGGEALSNLALVFVIAAWVVFLLNEPAAVAKFLKQPAPSTSSTGAKQ